MTQFSDSFGEFREKRPGSIADFGLNWGPFLSGDPIDTSDWTGPSGITILSSPPPSKTATTTSLWLSGGSLGQEYDFLNTIVTAGGRTWTRVLRIKIVADPQQQPAFSYTELAALRKAYAQGVLRVRYGSGNDQKEIEYPSGDELLKRIQFLESEISGTTPNKRFTLASHRRG